MLYPGDVVGITISTGLEKEKPTEWKQRIGDDGTVTIPLVGVVPISGLRLPDAEQIIRMEGVNRGKFVNPNVTVMVAARRSNSVTVVGEVTKPGTYQLPASNSTVLAAITAAEGLTKDADTILELQHPLRNQSNTPGNQPPRSMRIDLQQINQMNPAVFQVTDGTTVMVMKRAKRYVHVMGLVRKPDQFEMPEDQELRLLEAIAMGGGRTLEIADKVRVIRTVPNQPEPVVIEASVSEAKEDPTSNLRLAPGDVVSIEETPTTMVVGTLKDFVRFGFTSAIPGF